MPNGALEVVSNFTGESGYVIGVVSKTTAPLTVVDQVVYPAPHSQRSWLIENLSPVWYLVRFWRSADGVTLDEEILTLAGNARTGSVYPVSRYEYVVGRGQGESGVWADPVQDDTHLFDTRLAGSMYWIEERGTGSLLSSEIIPDATGFSFQAEGKVFNDTAVYIATVITRVDTGGSGDDSGAMMDADDIFILTADVDFDAATMGGRTGIAAFSTAVGTVSFPNLALIPDCRCKFQTHGGMQNNLVLQLDAGDTVQFRGDDVNQIILGVGEEAEILIKDNVMFVLLSPAGYGCLGEVRFAYLSLLNALPCDGISRALADFPRVVELLDNLASGAVVNFTVWNTSTVINDVTVYPNRGKWAREGANFKPPLLLDQMVKGMAAVDGSVVAGRYENQNTGAHFHYLAANQFISGDGSPLSATTQLASSNESNGNVSYRLKGTAVAATLGKTSSGGSGNNLVNNIGLFPLVCI